MSGRALLHLFTNRERATTADKIAERLNVTCRNDRASVFLERHEGLGEFCAHRTIDQHHRRRSRDTGNGAVNVVGGGDQCMAGTNAGAGGSKKFGHGNQVDGCTNLPPGLPDAISPSLYTVQPRTTVRFTLTRE